MAVDGDRSGKLNLGLSVKFEAKALKVIGYSRRTDRHWEFSQSTVDLVKEYKVIGEVLDFAFLNLARVGKIPRGCEAYREECEW